MLTQLFSWNSTSGKVLFLIAAINLFAMMCLTAADVFGRYALNAPIRGAHELIELMMALSVFAVLPILSARQDQISIGLLDRYFAGTAATYRTIIISLISLSFLILMSWRVWSEVGRSFYHGDATAYLRLPLAPVTAIMAVLATLAVVATVAYLVDFMRGRLAPDRSESHF